MIFSNSSATILSGSEISRDPPQLNRPVRYNRTYSDLGNSQNTQYFIANMVVAQVLDSCASNY